MKTRSDICPVGTVRIRTRRKRGGEQRAYVKIAQPNTWRLRAQVIWEHLHGSIPKGMGVHHKDENKLNDNPDNLVLLSKAKHLMAHRPGFDKKRNANFTKARRKLRWSTKSETKRTGRPPTHNPNDVRLAVDAYNRGEGSYSKLAKRFGVSASVIGIWVRGH